MTRQEFETHIEEHYGIKYDCPFEDDLDSRVFRHTDNRKWFALVMNIPKNRIIPNAEGYIDVVNLKCAPEIMDDLWRENGIFPAYHMSKKHWLTLALDGSCPDETVRWVTSISFDLTRKKIRNKRS